MPYLTIVEMNDDGTINDYTEFRFESMEEAVKAVYGNKEGFAYVFYDCAIVLLDAHDKLVKVCRTFSPEDIDKIEKIKFKGEMI